MPILLQLVWQAREAGAMCVLFIISSTHKKEDIENLFKLVLILYFYVYIVMLQKISILPPTEGIGGFMIMHRQKKLKKFMDLNLNFQRGRYGYFLELHIVHFME